MGILTIVKVVIEIYIRLKVKINKTKRLFTFSVCIPRKYVCQITICRLCWLYVDCKGIFQNTFFCGVRPFDQPLLHESLNKTQNRKAIGDRICGFTRSAKSKSIIEANHKTSILYYRISVIPNDIHLPPSTYNTLYMQS